MSIEFITGQHDAGPVIGNNQSDLLQDFVEHNINIQRTAQEYGCCITQGLGLGMLLTFLFLALRSART